MKKIIYALVVTCLIAASTAFAKEGNEGGGGGNLAKAPTVSIDQLRQFVISDDAARILSRWFNTVEAKVSTDTAYNLEFVRLASAKVKPTELINQLRIQLLENGACKDSQGRARDGSVITETPYTICLSLKRIATKVNYYDYKPRLLSLIVHEMTHILLQTRSEESAVWMENLSYADFMKVDWESLSNETKLNFREVAVHLEEAYGNQRNGSTGKSCENLSDATLLLQNELALYAPESLVNARILMTTGQKRDRAARTAFRVYAPKLNHEFKTSFNQISDLAIQVCEQKPLSDEQLKTLTNTAMKFRFADAHYSTNVSFAAVY